MKQKNRKTSKKNEWTKKKIVETEVKNGILVEKRVFKSFCWH